MSTATELLSELAFYELVSRQSALRLHQLEESILDGSPPDRHVADHLNFLADWFASIQTRSAELAATIEGVRPVALASVADVRLRLESVELVPSAEVISEETALAYSLIDKIRRLQHRDLPSYPDLAVVREGAARLQESLDGKTVPEMGQEQLQKILSGAHAYCHLMQLVEHSDELADDQWQLCYDAVAQEFGKTVATAASRRRLVVADHAKIPEPPTTSEPECIDAPEPPEIAPIDGLLVPSTPPVPPVDYVVEAAPDPEEQSQRIRVAPESEVRPAINADSRGLPEPAEDSEPVPFPLFYGSHLGFVEEQSARLTAQQLLSGGDQLDAFQYGKLMWQLIREGKESLAYELANCGALIFSRQECFEPNVLKSIVLARQIRNGSGTIAHEIKRALQAIPEQDLFQGRGYEWNRGLRLLLAAGSLVPALLDSSTHAAQVFHEINFEDGLQTLWEVGNRMIAYASNVRESDLSALVVGGDETKWQSSLSQLRSRVDSWWSQARAIRFIYAPARQVWRRWLEDGQLVASLLSPIRTNDRSALSYLKAEFDKFSDDAAIRAIIDRTDRTLRRRGDAITAAALAQLKRHLRDEVLSFVREWTTLQVNRPAEKGSFHYNETQQLRAFILDRRQLLGDELDRFEQQHIRELPTRAGVACCRIALQTLYDVLLRESSSDERDVRYILHSDLLRVPNLTLSDDWEAASPNPELLARGLLAVVAQARYVWFDNLRDRSADGDRDHEATARIIEFVAATEPDNPDLDAMRAFRTRHLAQCQETLQRDIEETRSYIESAVAFDLLNESERAEQMSTLEPLHRSITNVLRFGESARRLEAIRHNIDQRRLAALDAVRLRLEQSTAISVGTEAYARIQTVLGNGDIYTANEYLEMAEAGYALPISGERRDAFREFFPQVALALEAYLDTTAPATILQNMKQRLPLGGRDLLGLDEPHLGGAAAMVEGWFTAKRQQRMSQETAAAILQGLGFPLINVQSVPTSVRNRLWLHVQCDVIADRERCPVFFFGSQANGRYRVLCLWDRPADEDILSYAGESPHGAPLIIFYFGPMPAVKRRNIARLCRDSRRTCLILDETLLLFLCSETGSRLASFFGCAMPFTYVEPYTTTAGNVPPEMFYGRRREMESISDPHGSCFIYGGRQLGKTALLRAAERSFHSLPLGRIARWLDLKAEGLGFNRAPDEIWPLIANLLKTKENRILPQNFSAYSDPARLFEHVRNWLKADKSRRILLLLDEADRFLESDATENFTRSVRLKNWMDQTDRRFKVVFAGLHNVQRVTRQANNPLAHFGEPLCIGPLLEHGEWKEARALIERPLEAIGFRFESPDLVTRILSQTNYYPSLIQLYCNQLLRFFAKRHYSNFDPRESPPYRISSKDVQDAYQGDELRRDIRNRFWWTLDLDPRYRVIALSIAFGVAVSRGGAAGDPVDNGFSVAWIREQAFSFWKKGFESVQSQDEFVSLLQEMVGLGVLRDVRPGHYALRSPNLLNLLGTEDEIALGLEEASKEEPLPVYEPERFRTGDPASPMLRSPLTAAQESEIDSAENGVSVVFGSEAAGLHDMRHFLRLAKEDFFVDLDGENHSHSVFMQGLTQLKGRELGGTTVAFVSQLSAWDESWIGEADRRIRELSPKRNFLRAVFAADPHTTWILLRNNHHLIDTLNTKNVKSFTLSPWHDSAIKQWLNDDELRISLEDRDRLSDVTGRWPAFLYDVYARSKEALSWTTGIETFDASSRDPDRANAMCKRFGIDIPEPRKVLHFMADLGGPSSPEEIFEFMEGTLPLEMVELSVAWADLLRFTRPVGSGCWSVDPALGRILKAAGPQ